MDRKMGILSSAISPKSRDVEEHGSGDQCTPCVSVEGKRSKRWEAITERMYERDSTALVARIIQEK